MKILNLEGGSPFSMGKGKNWSVLNPDVGAEGITLNHSLHDDGHEFPQHIHDESIDIILVLEGAVQLRQGEHYTPLAAGEAALIPAGEVHGTVNRSGRTARLISFQIPPDLALYRGERNKADSETPKPQPGGESTVEIVALAKGGPRFASGAEVRNVFSPRKSSPTASLDYLRLASGEEFAFSNSGSESVFVLLSGRLTLDPDGESRALSAFDVLFLKGRESARLRNPGDQPALVVHCCALG
jgi:quercetin dioxygenase-like cupin family protein